MNNGEQRCNGFTMLEVLVALVIASIVVGGVMGSLSSAMRLEKRSQDKQRRWTVLETALRYALANPHLVMAMEDLILPDGTKVGLEKRLVNRTETGDLSPKGAYLVRVRMRYERQAAEVSLTVPRDFHAPEGAVVLPTVASMAKAFDDDEVFAEYAAEDARKQAEQDWRSATSSQRVTSTRLVSGGAANVGGSMLADASGAARPAMSGGSSGGGGAGGWADPVEDGAGGDAGDGDPGQDVAAVDPDLDETGDASSQDGGGDQGSGDGQDDGGGEETAQVPDEVKPPGEWKTVYTSETDYVIMNTETGQMLRIWQGGPEVYMRWQKEWIN